MYILHKSGTEAACMQYSKVCTVSFSLSIQVNGRVSTVNVMEPYNVVQLSNIRERETQATASQEDMLTMSTRELSPTQTDEDAEYSIVENDGEERHTMDSNIAEETHTYSTISVLDIKSNIRSIRQGLANGCTKNYFGSTGVEIYTNVDLKNQMSSTNKQIQSMNKQLNNQSSQHIQILQAQLSDSILLLQNNFSEQLSSTNK